MTHDGLGKYLSQVVEKAPGKTADVVGILKETQTDVVVSYLPVGSEAATKWYAEQILEVTRQSFDYYHALFGIHYPFGEYHQVFVPEFNAGAMENPGCVTFRDPLLFRDAPWTLTIEPDTDLDAWLRLAELVCDLGAKPVPTTAAEQDAAVARVIGLPHVLAEALALSGLAGGPLGLSLAASSYMSGSRVARTRPDLVATWCDGNPSLVTALDDVIARLVTARDELAAARSVLDLAEAGHDARINWEHRRFEPVELRATFGELCAHGRAGGWITAVLRDDDGVRLLGMRPPG